MAAREAQERRASERAKRRSKQPEPEADEQSEAADALREAASAAIVGAAVGAVQAFARKRHEEPVAEEEPQEDEPESEAEPEPEEAEAEPEPEPESESVAEREAPAPPPSEPGRPGDASKMVQHAREQLLELRGAEAESVSGVARTANGWRVGLEVVEVRRIPESTDVLATYEVELDADGELLTFERARRYYRSEADRR